MNTKLQNFTNTLSNLFLLCLGLLAFQSIFGQAIFGFNMVDYSIGSFLLGFIQKTQYLLVILAIVFGSLILKTNKKSLDDIFIEKQENKKNNFLFYIIISILLIFSGFLFSINISNLSFEDDEFYTVSVANNLHETGKLYQWDWINDIPGETSELCEKKDYCKYERSYIYTYLVEFSYNFFGVSEFSTRLPGMILYFLTILSLIIFFIKLKLRKSFIVLTLLLTIGSSVFFSNFFIARMYGLLIFSSLISYILVIYIDKYKSEKKYKKMGFSIFLLLLTIFVGYNSHINYLIFIGMISLILLFINFNFINRKLLKINIKIKIVLLFIIFLLFSVLFYKIDFYRHFKLFITFREDPGYYFRYLYYIFDSSLGQIRNNTIHFLFGGLAIVTFIFNLKLNKRPLFVLPYIVVFFSSILYIYFLDTKLFISDRYVSNINIFAVLVISMTIFVLGNNLTKKKKVIYFIIIFLISFFGIIKLYGMELNKKNKFANYTVGYEKLLNNFDKNNDIMIGIPIRDYYIKGLGNIIKISASQRFDKYNFNKFKKDLEKYNNKNIYFIYSDIKSFHVNDEIKKYLKINFNIFSHNGNVLIYKIQKKED